MVHDVLIGIDVGTQGARVVASDPAGAVLAQAERSFPRDAVTALPAGWFEQDPNAWWSATAGSLREVTAALAAQGIRPEAVRGVSVTSTSGTVVAVDGAGNALGSALMYNDRRSEAEAREVGVAGAALAAKLGYGFASSFALPKILWLRKHDPARFRAARRMLSPTDFIVGRLSGVFDVTDYTNALKTGYDLLDQRWPGFISDALGLPAGLFPRVVAPGAPIGAVSAATCGLAAGTPVLAGMTDGCASQVSTGAIAPGQWNSTLGTTLVIKGVTRQLLRDPQGRVYCHRHPDGHWLPGGASNTGGECITQRFGDRRATELEARVRTLPPTGVLVYPLLKPGERFPFVDPAATGFALGDTSNEAVHYLAHLEGVASVERLAYEVLAELGAVVGDTIHVAGGASKSAAWLQVRADLLGKALHVPAAGGGAMGAAILAAAGTVHRGLVPAAQAMVRIERTIEPRPDQRSAYNAQYARFRAELVRRGHLRASR
jgi:sugar (pentulose or hexulose) kinase